VDELAARALADSYLDAAVRTFARVQPAMAAALQDEAVVGEIAAILELYEEASAVLDGDAPPRLANVAAAIREVRGKLAELQAEWRLVRPAGVEDDVIALVHALELMLGESPDLKPLADLIGRLDELDVVTRHALARRLDGWETLTLNELDAALGDVKEDTKREAPRWIRAQVLTVAKPPLVSATARRAGGRTGEVARQLIVCRLDALFRRHAAGPQGRATFVAACLRTAGISTPALGAERKKWPERLSLPDWSQR
jgi:hypothetical protein